MRITILLVLFGGCALAQVTTPPKSATQTKLNPSQIRTPTVQAPAVFVVTPDRGILFVQLDPAGFTLDMSATPPILRLKPQTTPVALPSAHQVFRNGDMSFTLPTGRYGSVYYGGILQLPTIDYVIEGGKLRFLGDAALCCTPDENVVVMVYQN